MSNLTSEQIQAILDGAPEGAIEHCLYDYGDSTCPIYLNCENQFYDDDEKEWVDILLIDNYFHSRRRLSDLREILTLRQEVERLKDEVESVNHDIIEAVKKARTQWAREDVEAIKKRDSEVAAQAVEGFASELKERAKNIPFGAEHKGHGSSTYNWQMFYAGVAVSYANQLREQGDV